MGELLEGLGLPPFRQRFPWLGPDLQMLRDRLRRQGGEGPETAQIREFPLADGGRLLARLEVPPSGRAAGLVVVVHGLGGGSDDGGQRRLGRALAGQGLAALRLNLRGAGPGRALARGTYAASCNADLLPVLRACRRLAAELAPAGGHLPLAAVGLSLGGTVLLNALLDHPCDDGPLLDALVCVSSPLDLSHCADHLERPRNRLYQSWLVRRLIAQTLADPHGVSAAERQGLAGGCRPRTIRAFDALITAPRWGFADVAAYYGAASPLAGLRRWARQPGAGAGILPPLLLVHAADDPWVPVDGLRRLAEELAALPRRGAIGGLAAAEVVITARGGHNGFHGCGDSPAGCWSDRLAALWLAGAGA